MTTHVYEFCKKKNSLEFLGCDKRGDDTAQLVFTVQSHWPPLAAVTTVCPVVVTSEGHAGAGHQLATGQVAGGPGTHQAGLDRRVVAVLAGEGGEHIYI